MKNNLKKMAGYYKPYMGTFVLDMFFAFLASLISLVIPLVVRYITTNVTDMDTSFAVKQITIICGILVILVLIQFAANYFITNIGHVMGAKMEYDMRAEIFDHYQKLSFSFYDDQKVGQLMSRITSDLFEITELLHHGPENLAISSIKIIGAFIILSSISGYLTLAAFILLPFMFAYAYFMNKRMRKAFRENRVQIAEVNSRIEDNLSGIRVVKSFANEDIEKKKFKIGNDGFLRAKKESYFYMGFYHSGMTAFTMLINVVVIFIGGIFMAKGTVSAADFVTFLLYINVFTDPIRTLVDFAEQFQNGYSGFERFAEILAIEPDIKDSETAVPLENVRGDIKFDDVSFKYKDTAHRVLRHINLDVKAGSYVALVGSSGGGKTTLCSLIPRFYDVTKGSISIDGRDIREVTLSSLRQNIGIVQQDVYLFAGTVYENISYGKPDASREEIIEAAKLANAHDFICRLPDGYNTYVGEKGHTLSGGERQRIAIARAILPDPRILILDEATASLDTESEFMIQKALERLTSGKTTFAIAHRLSTLKNADRIMVIDGHSIAEIGTHQELLDRKGIYYNLFTAQLAKS